MATSKVGEWENTETFVMYSWLSTNEGGRKLLKEVRSYHGNLEEKATELRWKIDRALTASPLDRKKRAEHDLFFNFLTVSIARVNFEQLIQRA